MNTEMLVYRIEWNDKGPFYDETTYKTVSKLCRKIVPEYKQYSNTKMSKTEKELETKKAKLIDWLENNLTEFQRYDVSELLKEYAEAIINHAGEQMIIVIDKSKLKRN